MKVKSESEDAQSCPTLPDTMDCSPPGASVHGIFQAGVLEWGAFAFSDFADEDTEIPERLGDRPPKKLWSRVQWPACLRCTDRSLS